MVPLLVVLILEGTVCLLEYKGVDLVRDTFIEVNLDHLAYNMKNIKERVGEAVSVAAVVKANGYGHGAIGIAKTLMENGASHLAVATLSEAMELRNEFESYPILVMGYTPNNHLKLAVENNIALTIFQKEQAEILNALNTNNKPLVHIKYDTGFNRLGFKDCEESISVIKDIVSMKNLEVEGIFSHFALAGNEANHKQYNDFLKAIDEIGYNFKYKHICDSIAAIDYPEFNMDMIRPGAILYGMKSFRKNDIDLKPVMSFKTKVYHVKTIEIGEGVSYNYKWKAERKSVIATIPVGYSDGMPRNMTDVGSVTIKGIQVPIIGVICMDQCMIDVTDVPEVKVGEEVIIFDDGSNGTLTVEQVSKIGKTNKNEILSRITRRTPRVYIKNGTVDFVIDYLLGRTYYDD